MIVKIPEHPVPVEEKQEARTPVTTSHDYGPGGYVRTALVLKRGASNEGSVDLVTELGVLIARVNLFYSEEGALMVDVIDTENHYKHRRVLSFPDSTRKIIDCGNCNIAAVDFRNE